MSLQVLLVLLGSASAPNPTSDTSICPAVSASQMARVQQWFGSELTLPLRQQFGLVGITPADVRPLTDAQDAEACRRIASTVTLPQNGPYPKVWRGYRAGAFYVMHVTLQVPPGVFYKGDGTGMIFLDSNMRIVGAAS